MQQNFCPSSGQEELVRTGQPAQESAPSAMRSRGGRGGAPSLVALAAVLAGSAAPAQAFLPFGSNSGATKPEPAAGGGCAGMGAGVDMRAAVRAHVPGKDKALMDRSPGKDNGDPLKLYNFKSAAPRGGACAGD